ncbi:DUF6265 family protein [Urechidicola croceus]|nr:DUF6265 family protein [Urechidicola croceus]
MKKILFILTFCTVLFNHAQSDIDVYLFDLEISNDEYKLSNIVNVSNNEGYDNQPSFIDNNTIVYAGTRNNQTDIVKYSIDTSKKTWINTTEGSEYSPLKIPNENAVSSIRLEENGDQKLYSYNLETGESEILVDKLIIGYHTWFIPNILISSVLDYGNLSLFVTNVNEQQNHKIESHIGRSLHKIPNSEEISFISKMNDLWEIRSFNVSTSKVKFIVPTLENIEDMCWTPDGTILMAQNNILYKFNPKKDNKWIEIASLKEFGIVNITRLAVNNDGSKLALVAENEYQKLEPKLENISWITGNWKGEAFGGITEENWSEPSGGSMMATFKLINDGKVTFYEIEIIREIDNTLILQLKHFGNDLKGWETKDETVDFPLKEITPNKVVFEGMSFEKISKNEMNVYVDIHQKDGTIETVKFKYTK